MEPVVVEFPLRGEWVAPNTPGHVVPSHGTDVLGQTYAYDFIQIDWSLQKAYRTSQRGTVASLVFGTPLKECMAWSQPIHAPFPGEIIEAEDGLEERNPIHPVRDIFVALKNGFAFKKAKSNRDLRPMLGNYIILRGTDALAMFAHARNGSVRVKPGDQIITGQKIAEVGHSGNSTSAHLHFQLMDNADLLKAKGIPCCFREYDLFENGAWRKITNGIPGRRDRIRRVDA